MNYKIKHKVCVIGHFGVGHTLLNGQTVKTVIVTDELEHEVGQGEVWRIDTHGKLNQYLMFPKIIWALFTCEDIIIFPANGALLYEVPWLNFWNRLFRKKLFYIVIGGWLRDYLIKYPSISTALKKYEQIFVETSTMKRDLEKLDFLNITVLPNCKPLKILNKGDLIYSFNEPLPIVTFSRVMEGKGIGDLVNVVDDINKEFGRNVLKLDIYGQIDNNEVDWFENLKQKFGDAICYKGSVAFDKSTSVLSQYFALVFPTKYYTEGVPGTIIDAYSAGLPVISSRWANFDDVIDDGVTGLGYGFMKLDELKHKLINIVNDPNIIYQMKESCLKKAAEYTPEKIIPILTEKL